MRDSEVLAKDVAAIAKSKGIDPALISRDFYIKHGGAYCARDFAQVGGWGLVKRTYFGNDPRKEGEIRAMQAVNQQVNKLRRQVGDVEYLAERIERAIVKLKPLTIVYKPRPSTKKIHRTLNANLSDAHWGSDLVKAEHLRDYGPDEEASALWSVVENICEYKTEHRSETELVLNVLGDMIENELHGQAGAAPLHLQVCRGIYLLTQSIGFFSASFPKVRVHFAVGNHGRDKSIHPQRATHMKYNGLETTLYYAVKAA